MIFRRIVVALGTSSASTAMTTAVDLARAMEADLLGLFVEDTALLDLAALPIAGEIAFPSATRRALDVEAMERGLRAQATRTERALAARLAGQPIKWTFEVVRGRIVAELLATAGESDLAIVAVPAPAARSIGALAVRGPDGLRVPLLLVGEWVRHPASIAVLTPADADPRWIVDVVAALAPHYGRAATFVAVGPGFPDGEPWQRELRERLAERALTPRFRIVAGPRGDEIDRLLATERPRLLVLIVGADQASGTLLDRVACPLLVLPDSPRRDRAP